MYRVEAHCIRGVEYVYVGARKSAAIEMAKHFAAAEFGTKRVVIKVLAGPSEARQGRLIGWLNPDGFSRTAVVDWREKPEMMVFRIYCVDAWAMDDSWYINSEYRTKETLTIPNVDTTEEEEAALQAEINRRWPKDSEQFQLEIGPDNSWYIIDKADNFPVYRLEYEEDEV